jgi:hypothetical protein
MDIFFAVVLVAFSLLSWGLVELCSWLMGGER